MKTTYPKCIVKASINPCFITDKEAINNLGRTIHTFLRKYCDDDMSSLLWNSINCQNAKVNKLWMDFLKNFHEALNLSNETKKARDYFYAAVVHTFEDYKFGVNWDAIRNDQYETEYMCFMFYLSFKGWINDRNNLKCIADHLSIVYEEIYE